ncbi:MAG: PH domain-containing protein [Actinobacteria bacterium]|nr:PH domain-containing protein [Actinomycetota bacterium]
METSRSARFVLDGSVRRLDPKVRTKWALERSVVWLIAGVVILVVGLATGNGALTMGAIIGTTVLVTISLISAALSYRFWSWSAHEDAIELSHGVVFRHLSVVPFHRVQQIDVTRDPLERVLGIATLILRSAAATTDARIPGITLDETDPLRHALLERAGVDDAV